MSLTRHQRKLLALVEKHGPVTVQSRNVQDAGQPYPRYMLDGTVWANLLALEGLLAKGRVRRRSDSMIEIERKS